MKTLLVGYGTLLHKGSLGHTIGSDAADEKGILPVVVHGYRRLFNLRPTHYESSSKLTTGGIENAAMNVEPAPDSSFNGLGFDVTLDELEALDERERYYERVVEPLHHFETDELLGEGHFYVSKPDAEWIERDPDRLLPLWRDIVWARGGSYGVGHRFGLYFDETTYLADGVTLMVERYADVLDDTDDLEMPQ